MESKVPTKGPILQVLVKMVAIVHTSEHHKWHTLFDIVSFGWPSKRWSLYLHTMNPE